MKEIRFVAVGLLVTVLLTAVLPGLCQAKEEAFTLVDVVPSDVFLCVAERKNPEREFLDLYWGDVFEQLHQSGISEDVIELFNSLVGNLDDETATELERLKERALRLVSGVDWDMLGGRESVFAERFVPLQRVSDNDPPILMPSMVWLCRGHSEGAAKNHAGLAAILEVLVEEVNRAAGGQILSLTRSTRMGAEVASVNLMAQIPGQQSFSLSVARRHDILIIGVRDQLFNDVLAIMEGSSEKRSLATDTRFKNAFAHLPPAEDGMTFFDMQAMLKSLRASVEMIINKATGPRDVYRNTALPAEVNGLNGEAMSAYRQGDVERALELTRKAYEIAPKNSVILYNLACFNAAAGNEDKALAWLGKAVEGGFFAPEKIAGDADLACLHGKPAYHAALARATELSLRHGAKDTVINYANEGEAMRLRMQVHQTYETKDWEQGLKLIKQAYAIAPQDSKVIYTMACLHALLGHEEESLDFLEQAVEAGFYCPKHMTKDPDLKSVRHHERFKAAKAKAWEMAGKMAVRKTTATRSMVERIVDRVTNAVGILDYSASVEATDGFSITGDSFTALVPDAKQRPIYKLFGKRAQLADFDRFLPEETESFSLSGGIEFGALYEFIVNTVRLMGPPAEEALAKWKGLQKQLGIDLRKDLTDWIDGDSISVTLADGGGSVTLIKVRDETTARENITSAIEFGTTALREIISKKRELAGLAMLGLRTSPVKHAELEGFQNIHISMSPQPFVWGVANGYLIFGSSAEAIVLCLKTARGEHPSIRNNERAMSEAIVPTGPFAGMSLTDKRKMGQQLEGMLGMGTMVSGMTGAFIPDPEVRQVIGKISEIMGKLSPVVGKIDFYKSVATKITFDGQRWYSRKVTHYFSPEERKARGM